MLNYMRSEFYRIFHSRAFYVTLAAFIGLAMAVNVLLLFMIHEDPNFSYAMTSFSYSNYVVHPMWNAYAAVLITYILYEGTNRNGNLKNVVALGINREKIFLVRCIVSTVVYCTILAITLLCYIGSAELLLQTAGPVLWQDMFKTAAVAFFVAIASVVLMTGAITMVKKEWLGFFIWFAVFEIIPAGVFLLSLQFTSLQDLAMWMPKNFFEWMHDVSLTTFEPIWQSVDGLERCVISGLAGIVIFGIVCLWRVKKMEV